MAASGPPERVVENPESSGARPALANRVVYVFAAYALLLVAAQALVRVRAWDMRGFDANLIDYTWQVELPWRATRGEWSGRDFHFPMGPLWQVFALSGAAFGGFSAPAVIAGMQAATQLGGLGIALWLGRELRGMAKVAVVVVITAVAYGAGISTLRPLLSVVHLWLYARDVSRGDARRSSALAASAAATLLMLFSFDRLLFASLSVFGMASFEWLARRRAGLPTRVALDRFARYALAQAGWIALLALLARLAGASPVDYFVGQRRLTQSYAVNMATSGEGSPIAGAAAFALGAVVIACLPLLRRQQRITGAVLVVGALPLLGFSAVQPNPGHVFMGALPVLVVLCLGAARSDLCEVGPRAASALLASTFVLGWFGTFRGDLWLSPRALVDARAVLSDRLRPQSDFVTDLGRAAEFVRGIKAREPDLRCVGLSPALTAAHALADVPGPTSARIRWNADQREELGRDIRAAACPYFLYQIGGFDRPDRPNWFIGEDLLAISETYRLAERLGPATYVLERRANSGESIRESLPVSTRPRELVLGEELVLPLGRSLDDADLLLFEYSLAVPRWSTLIGAAPRLEYRFEHGGEPLSGYLEFSDLSVNRPTKSLLAVNPIIAEARFIGLPGRKEQRSADSIRVRLVPRGRFTPRRASFALLGLTRIAPSVPLPAPEQASCELERDLLDDALRGRALPRNVALRPKRERMLLHPNPLSEQGAEVFFPVNPCADSCFFAEAGIDLPPGSGDGARFDVNVLDGTFRPRIAGVDVLPGAGPARVELSLARFADREILLRLGSLPRDDTSFDYLWVQRPRVARCSARTGLADAMKSGKAATEGAVDARGDDIYVGGGKSQIIYPFTVIEGSCLDLELEVPGHGPGFGFAITLRADHLLHTLVLGDVLPGAHEAFHQVSLHDWHKREVRLELYFERKPGETSDLRVVSPRLVRCAR